jgi:hypothetical protein
MGRILPLLEKMRALDTDAVIQDGLTETKEPFEKLNKEQMYAGKTNDGNTISPTYRNKRYALAKADMNQLPGIGIPDLFLTGAFYNAIDAEVGNGVIDIISKDEKGPALENKYPGIFGLGTIYKQQYQKEFLGPLVRQKISSIIGLSFK